MEYINAEEFLKQPQEVQNILLDWWQPSIGDIIYNKKYKQIGILEDNYEDSTSKNLLLYFSIPLLTEGQLRKIIEDKTKCIAETRYYKKDGWDIWIHDDRHEKRFISLSYDLLQAYWMVTCQIAEEISCT